MGLKKVCEKIILIIVTLSLLLTFVVAPSSYAKLTLSDGEFYYAGTTKGTYTASEGIFSWLLDNLSQIADWLVGIMTMGPRMVFVGWTALIERILTWTLETTTGVNINGDGVNSSTDLSSITDSSSNITVQAIVYNQVPAFDINFFDIEYDPTVSGTGHIYTCDKCNKECSDAECCGTSLDSCKCACNGQCDGCQAYMAALEVQEQQEDAPPVVIQLKTLVSGWYYVLRLLSLAAMLIVLLGIGIKMAISTIASEKAVYKRMLVDWLVGVIILVSIHYIMWFIIQINDTLVGVIKDSANSINQVQLKQLYDKNDAKGEKKEISNEEIEISVYEEIRTRAYDPKLSVGLSGMIMYMTLVYFAVRYSLVYLKRFLTLVVLTLMGPPVGVAYALQKAISGKSSTFKAWMTEYIMNVIIQSVHALIYAVFISEALVLSLQSVAGMIVALIFMNYALKAEKLFKQIFKMSSEGSLLESAEQAGDAEKIRSNFQAARGLYMGAKPVAGALMNTPLAKAVKGAGKVGAVGIGLGAKALLGKPENNSANQQTDDTTGNTNQQTTNNTSSTDESSNETQNNTDAESIDAGNTTTEPSMLEPKSGSIKQGVLKGQDTLRSELVAALVEYDNAPAENKEKAGKKLGSALGAYTKNMSTAQGPTTSQIVRGHIERATDMTNHFQLTPDENGNMMTIANFGNVLKGTFGTGHYDAKAGKWVSNGNAYYKQFGASKLLGFTDEDKKVFKEHVVNPIRNGFGGMAAMFVGMGTFVAHPSMGMALLAGGAVATRKTFKAPASSKKYKGTYGFSRFSVSSMNSIQRAAMARANREIDTILSNADSQMVNRIKTEHPDLYNSIRADLSNELNRSRNAERYVKPLTAGNMVLKGVTAGFISGDGIKAHAEAVKKHNVNQTKQQQLEFMKDGVNLQIAIQQDAFSKKLEKEEEELSKETLSEAADELGCRYDSETGSIIPTSKEEKAQEEFEKTIVEIYKDQGIIFDPKTGTTTPINSSSESDKKSIKVNKEELTENTDATQHKITDVDIKTINREIDIIVDEMIAKSDNHEIDMASEATQSKAMKALTDKLVVAGILKEDGKAEQVFKNGKAGLEDALKRRADFGNNKAKIARDTDGLDNEQKKCVRDIISQLSETSEKEIGAADVLKSNKEKNNKLDSSKDGSAKVSLDSVNPESLQKYINNLQRIEVTRSATQDTVEARKTKINKKSSNKMKKLEQILTLEKELSTDDTIEEVSNIKKNNGGKIGDVELSDKQASSVLELLFMRKEMEAINEFAVQELEINKGTNSYKKELKAKSKAAIDYYSEKLELEKTKQEHPFSTYSEDYVKNSISRVTTKMKEIDNDKSMNNSLNKAIKDALEDKKKKLELEIKDKETITKIEMLEKSVADKKRKLEKEENLLAGKGPMIDVDDFISKNFNSKK